MWVETFLDGDPSARAPDGDRFPNKRRENENYHAILSRAQLQPRDGVHLPLTGGPVALRAIGWEPAKDVRLIADFGDSFFMPVEWDRDGRIRDAAVSPFVAATVGSRSPHYNDQSADFAYERLRPIEGL